jgi:glycine hydroxymethyltransferase
MLARRHQVIANVKSFGFGLDVAGRLAEANIITNKNLITGEDSENWDRPSGLRIGTIEITRLDLMEDDMRTVADLIASVLVNGEDPATVARDVEAFRLPLQKFYYNFDHGWPASLNSQHQIS